MMDSDSYVLLKIVFGAVLIFIFYYPVPNFQKIYLHKKNKAKWDRWLSGNLSHEEYVTKYPGQEQGITCHFCSSTRQGHQLHQAIAKSMHFGFIENKINSKNTHYLSHYCSRCGSELFRSHHDV